MADFYDPMETKGINWTYPHLLTQECEIDGNPLPLLSAPPISYSKTDSTWPQPESEWQHGKTHLRAEKPNEP